MKSLGRYMQTSVVSILRSGLLFVLFGASAAPQQTPTTPLPPAQAMTSIPVREVRLRDGTARFTIPVRIGSRTVEAGLDTGSVGLRVLARALSSSDTQTSGTAENYAYGSGARLIGVQAQARVSIGQTSGALTIQLVNSIGCVPKKPNCPASRVPFEK